MEEEENQQNPRYWRLIEQVWGYTGTLAVVAVLGGTLGRGMMQLLHFKDSPANIVYCAGMTNPSEPISPQPVGILGSGCRPPSAHVQMLKNAEGHTVEARFVDQSGKLRAMPGSKVARQIIEYDKGGRVVRRSNLDAAGNPVEDAAGVSVREFAYDGAGQLVCRSYRGADGLPTLAHPTAIAEQRTTYDTKGRPLVVRNLGVNGLAKADAEGEETLHFDYDDTAGVELRRNFIHDFPANNEHGVAIQRITRNADGKEIRREWLDAGGNPVLHPQTGAASIVREYYPASRICRSVRLGPDGTRVQSVGGWTEHMVRHTASGLPEWECYTGSDGLPRDNPDTGYAEKVSLYSPRGGKAYEYFWRADGSHADCCEKRYAHSPDGRAYCLSLYADGSTSVAPTAAQL